MPKSKKKYASKNTLALLLIALPGITYLIINNYIPIVGTFIAFKKFSYAKGIWGSPWCGLDNFKFLFLTDDAWVITRNTLLYNLAFIVIGTVVSVILQSCCMSWENCYAESFSSPCCCFHTYCPGL